uniref:Uncharacterized protein n=1 Tax=Oryza sativa subsp. japonica TaxID=39947 RepID=Q8S7V3_ORYSJ|nr:hypothetical protein [Oryza sativa Japonica Group]
MAATSSLASSYLADLHRAGGASPSPLPRRIRSSSASGALAAARSASSPWPDPQDQPRLAVGDGVAGEEGHDTNEDHDTSQVSHDPSKVSLMKPGETEHDTKGDMIPPRFNMTILKYHLIPHRYHLIPHTGVGRRGIVADGRVLPRPRSTLNPNLVAGSRILPRPWSTSELVAGDRVLRRDLDTGDHVHRPRLSRWLRPPRRSSSPVPPPSPRRILRRPRPTPELVAGAVSVTTQDPPPSMRPAPCRSSPVAASSTLELVAGSRVRAADVNLIYAAPIVTFVL